MSERQLVSIREVRSLKKRTLRPGRSKDYIRQRQRGSQRGQDVRGGGPEVIVAGRHTSLNRDQATKSIFARERRSEQETSFLKGLRMKDQVTS